MSSQTQEKNVSFEVEENSQTKDLSTESQEVEQSKKVKLVDIEIVDQNTALNVLVSFIGVAQRRGAFAIDESAKIFESIKMFQEGQ